MAAYSGATADAEATEALFLAVRTPAELPAKGEKKRLAAAGLSLVALSSVDPNSAIVQLRRGDLRDLERKVNNYATTPRNVGKSYLSIIEDIAPVSAKAKLTSDLISADDAPIDCLLIFYASLSERERAAVLLAVRSYMARTGRAITVERRLSNGVTIVEARLRPSEALAVGAAFSTLRQVTPNHVFFVPDGWKISGVSPAVRVEPPPQGTAVAVIDTGISPSCQGVARAVTITLPQLPAGAVAPHMAHGTFVASRVLYGDDLERSLRYGVLRPRCPIIDVPVIGIDAAGRTVPVHEGHLAAAIDQAIPALPPSARVVNVSLGTNVPSVDGQISVVAQLLDKHARERDLLVVTTAGNIRDPHLLQAFPGSLVAPACRIDSPGDSLLAVTVGSVAKYDESGSLSRRNELSAFSRRGPGPFGGIKPDVVAHGGNCFGDGTTSDRIATHGLAASGAAWECDYGTSFSAPLVSAMGAQLFDHYGGPRANLVRALLLHFTDPVIAPSLAIDALHLIGLGEPNLDAARWSRDHSAAYLHVGALSPNAHTFLPFVVPSCLAAGGNGKLAVKVTVVLDPPVSPDNQVEYAKSRVSVALRKPAEVGYRTVGVSDDVVESDKWSPISQLARTFHRSYSTGEWELQLRLWARNVDAGFQQNFAAIIEVIDTTGTQPVRTGAEAEGGAGFRRIDVRAAA
ncbi:MAG: S8 family peptidase [Gemmatimonadaceae bacterium]|nr:S8 family peptidase [Gemmatimonadaceae bacterium]